MRNRSHMSAETGRKQVVVGPSPADDQQKLLTEAVKDLTRKVETLSAASISNGSSAQNVGQGIPLPEGSPSPEVPGFGPAHPGLVPLRAREAIFHPVVDYRAYKLFDTRSSMSPNETGELGMKANRLRQLMPAEVNFQGKPAIGLFEFLSEYKDGCDRLQIHKAMALLMLHYFLGKEPQSFVDTLRRVGVNGSRADAHPCYQVSPRFGRLVQGRNYRHSCA